VAAVKADGRYQADPAQAAAAQGPFAQLLAQPPAGADGVLQAAGAPTAVAPAEAEPDAPAEPSAGSLLSAGSDFPTGPIIVTAPAVDLILPAVPGALQALETGLSDLLGTLGQAEDLSEYAAGFQGWLSRAGWAAGVLAAGVAFYYVAPWNRAPERPPAAEPARTRTRKAGPARTV
jgi:hypothetical protein